MVTSAKFISDSSHGHLRDLTDNIHGNLSCIGNLGRTFGRTDIFRADPKSTANFRNDSFYCNRNWLIVGQNFPDSTLCKQNGWWGLSQFVIGIQLLYNALELSDVIFYMVCNVFFYNAWNLQVQKLLFF